MNNFRELEEWMVRVWFDLGLKYKEEEENIVRCILGVEDLDSFLEKHYILWEGFHFGGIKLSSYREEMILRELEKLHFSLIDINDGDDYIPGKIKNWEEIEMAQ